MKKTIVSAMFFGFCLFASSCATMVREGFVTANDEMPPFYPATIIDGMYFGGAFIIDKDWSPAQSLMVAVFCIIDLPFSLLFDTVLLPYDTWRYCNKDQEDNSTSTSKLSSGAKS